MSSNKIADVIDFFRKELEGIYDRSEIDVFIYLCAQEYLGLSRTDLQLKKGSAMSESEMLKFNTAIKQLKDHRPIQYILGKTEFYGMTLKVNEDVLIPRPETEELVEWIREYAAGKMQQAEILDIGTGSGCIALALKKMFPAGNVHAMDVSDKALEVAKANAAANELKVNFIHFDMLERKDPDLPQLDIIVSNPPYIRQSEMENMDRNVVVHEPHIALFVPDEDPLIFYGAIADLGLRKLNRGGKLFFEINEALGQEVSALLGQKGYWDVEVKKDMSGKDRMVSAGLLATGGKN
jgi:release factor glutamine methyltransferase